MMTDKIDVEEYNEIFKLLEIITKFLEILDNIEQLQQSNNRIAELEYDNDELENDIYASEDKFQRIEKITEKLRTKTDYKNADEVNSDLDLIQQIIKDGE